MTKLIARFKNDESGATAIEYGLIAGLLSIAIVLSAAALGVKLDAIFTAIAAALPTI